MPNSPKSLERLFQSNTRMSPSRSRKPVVTLKTRRNALNRAAHALAELKEARKKHAELARNIGKLEREYHKLARRAAIIVPNANLRSGPLTNHELFVLGQVSRMTKNMSVAARTTKKWGLPYNLRNKIARMTPIARR